MKKNFEKLFFSHTRDYLDKYLTSELARSPKTIDSYRDALTVFRRFITDVKKISLMAFTFEDCTTELVLSFMEYLQNKGIEKSTCNHRVAALHSYLWYVSDIDISVLPTAITISHLPFLRVPKVERAVISQECMTALLSAPDCTRRIGVRDTMIMVILYDTAIRLSELRNLKVSDFNISCDAPYVRIHGKGDKERLVAMSDKTVDHVHRYLDLYHDPASPKTGFLIYTVIHGAVNQMSSGNVQRLINKYADQIRPEHPDLPDHVHPHMFRRSRATELYQNGVALELISRMLGQASTTTTRIYAKPSVEMIHEAMDTSNAMSGMESEPIWNEAMAGSNEEMARYFGLR